jgi:arylsulfatase A-like enzyme
MVIPAFAAQRPNVILVMTDDQGYGELSCHGNPVLKTPNLDRLHGQSLRLTDFHVAPMCTPTRGQLMTGLDAARNGAVNVSSGRTLLRPGLPTMADFFAANGYRTAMFGKWHLGDNYPYRPQDRGFQETLWFPSSHINSLPDFWDNDYFDDTYIHNGKRERFKGYCTDVFFEQAMAWMKARADAGEPFFTYLPTNAPHGPHWVPKQDRKAMEADFARVRLPGLAPGLKGGLISYLAMIRNIDTNMARLNTFLEKEGLTKNTVLVFLTDNGTTFGHRYYNAGMRGHKTELWEGGHRVPCFIRWPGGGLGEPRDIDGVTQVQDLLPTLIDLCGLVTPTPPKLDGISLAPVLRGKAAVPADRMVVINYSRMPFGLDYPTPDSPSIVRPEGSAVLWKRWRLLRGRELYDLTTDPKQQTEVSDRHPKVAARMKAHLDAWWEGVRKIANEPQRVVIGGAEDPTKLTACEWLDVFVDQQQQVRRGVRKNGYWHLEVAKAGEYEFELRRWPRESGLALTAGLPATRVTDGVLPPGVALPIARARIFAGGIRQTKRVAPDAESAVFRLKLERGPILLHTWFDDERREPICGAYYVYVRRK